MILCKDCKYCETPKTHLSFCIHPKAISETSIVTGIEKHYCCITMRDPSGGCGPQANLFVDRKTPDA